MENSFFFFFFFFREYEVRKGALANLPSEGIDLENNMVKNITSIDKGAFKVKQMQL